MNAEQQFVVLSTMVAEMLAELKRIRADLEERTASTSSAELKQTSKEVALTVKVYDQSPVPLDDAISEFARGMRAIQQLQANGWVETAGALGGKPG